MRRYLRALRLPIEKDRQGRVFIDAFLQAAERCFIAGDAASFSVKGQPLRMAVQFALSQGRCAAKNVPRAISG